MDNEHEEEEEEEEINLTNGQRASSLDSLDQTDLISTTSESLRFISGYHKWINTDDRIRVDKPIDYDHQNSNQTDIMLSNDDHNSIQQNTLSANDIDIIFKTHSENEEDEDNYENSLSHMDISLNHFDIQNQNNNDRLEQPFRDEKFSSILSNIYQTDKINRNSQTLEIEMDNGDNNSEKANEYSQHRNNHEESYRRNRQTNGASNNNNRDDGNRSNPNRNNNNSR
ncbi:unnamed protein product, partial [Rotaria magnacalcarata]